MLLLDFVFLQSEDSFAASKMQFIHFFKFLLTVISADDSSNQFCIAW